MTESPTLDWVKIQIRTVAAFDRKPRFLLHDNDGVFSDSSGGEETDSAVISIAGCR